MSRVYPPIWCQEPDCKKCDFLECDRKILSLFAPLKYDNLDFVKIPKQIDITSIAVYFGFCQRLAKFFLLFPQNSPITVVSENFINSTTDLPATASIQRVLLDILNHGDAGAPTHDVHRLRLMLILKATKRKVGRMIIGSEEDTEVKVSEGEMNGLVKQTERWLHDLFAGRIAFEKTGRLDRCTYCFLNECESL
jgi:hypothetical protein